ncbi:MAG: prepilin-type N-terminal cleavage/methylation domain-containing protein [Candidatus Riflebacteria bacterium]|nr:prepilin-type N-terminal cleavage/methylation domain-containing protein [Candidatus Riflebacteria bacterium]MBR4571247.1 prepilin-type N-terminal cleavage/methylation domain-containing protein [Candidatus Riflebacteria bacterium]
MNKKGFTLIELLIVIAIISILVGVAVPYYNDYVIESRRSVLQSNLATIKKAINQFRADNQRGPAMVDLKDNGVKKVEGLSDPFDELVNGPLQCISGQWVRRSNIKYLNSRPVLEDPVTGAAIGTASLILGPGNCFIDASKDYCDVKTDWAYIDTDGNGKYDAYDVRPFNFAAPASPETATRSLDFIDIFVKE